MEPLLPKKNVNKCDDCDINLIQREDDNEKIIRRRLKTYYETNLRFVDFYRKQNILVDFEPKKGVKDYPELRKLMSKHYDKQTTKF